MSVRVLLADDHALVRQGLRSLLERSGFQVVSEASDGREAIRQCAQLLPDVVVMDISMPTLNGVDAARELRKSSPRTRIVLLTQHSEDIYVSEAIEAGVHGYVLKSQASGDLVSAIQEVVAGRVYLSPGVASAVVSAYHSRGGKAVNTLTSRERQVLQLIAEGKSTKDIASLLFISVKTAESHRTRLMQKLDIHETASLVRYAIRHGLVSP